MAKGQAEFVVIIGIVVVATVVVLYAYAPNIVTPPPPTGKYGAVKTSFEALVRDGTQQTIMKLSQYGGYLDNSSFPLGSVTFLGKQVPYWQYNGQIQTPDVKGNFVKGLQDYVSQNKDGMLQAMGVSGVELGDTKVSANFLTTGKIVVTVSMPTTVDGQKHTDPYSVEIQTRLPEIDEFSKGFVAYEKASRPLEYYTLSSMLISPMEQSIHSVPIFIFLTDCGEYVFKNWYDVKPHMEDVIVRMLANTYMPGKQKTHPSEIKTQYTLQEFQSLSRCNSQSCIDSAWLGKGTPAIAGDILSPQYAIVPINGKRYDDIDVSFQLPDGFQLTQANFQFSPDPLMVLPKLIPLVGQCQSDPVYVNYYVTYPAIVRVKDPLTDNVFQFAVNIYIKDNKPGEWASASGYESGIQQQICSNPQCAASITLVSSSGKPIDSASISFMGCELGMTNSRGVLSVPAPCGIGPLQVFKDGYESYSRMQSSDNISDLSVSVVKTPFVRMHFYEVAVQNMTLSGRYEISKDAVSALNSGHTIYMNLLDYSENKSYERGFNSAGGELSMIPAGNYVIAASVLDKANTLGGIVVGYPISEDLDGKDLYVYLPTTLEYGKIAESCITNDCFIGKSPEMGGAAAGLSTVLAKCGLGPISTSEIKGFNGCSVGYNEV
jgi:hypothetical protein